MRVERLKVLSLGQCAADSYAIGRLLEENFDAAVVAAATLDEALRLLQADSFALVLINRILDADGASGLACIARLRKDAANVPVMLVSNHASVQQEAFALGAVPGFGKAALRDPKTVACLARVLAPS